MDRLRTFKYWSQDNWQIITGVSILVVFFSLLIYVNSNTVEVNRFAGDAPAGSMEEVHAMREVADGLDEVFSTLQELRLGSKEEYPAYDVSLYLKKPYMDDRELRSALDRYIEISKWRDNYMLSGMKIKIYDRREVFEKDLKPRATVYYMEKLTDKDMLDVSEGGERVQGEDIMEIVLQRTIEVGKEPKYQDYAMRVHGFKALNQNNNITPLTDQEFSFYLKMDLYRTIVGGSRYGSARLYLQWDLGKDVYQDGIVAIEREFQAFQARHVDSGGQTSYYDNELLAMQDLSITHPQFLLFAIGKKVEDDPLDAQMELIRLNQSLFRRTLEKHVEEQSEIISKEFEPDEEEELEVDYEIEFEEENIE